MTLQTLPEHLKKMPPNYFEVNSFQFKSVKTKKVTLHFFFLL